MDTFWEGKCANGDRVSMNLVSNNALSDADKGNVLFINKIKTMGLYSIQLMSRKVRNEVLCLSRRKNGWKNSKRKKCWDK